MVVKGININEIEEQLKYVSELTTQIKILQDQFENIYKNIKNNDSDFKLGKISKEMYVDTKSILKRKINIIENDINKLVNDVSILLGELCNLLKECKV